MAPVRNIRKRKNNTDTEKWGDSVKLPTDIVKSLYTCTICSLLYVEATTINVCLDTFCKACITRKITEEGITACPICGEDLGNSPLNTLRPDRNVNELRQIIFPTKHQADKIENQEGSRGKKE